MTELTPAYEKRSFACPHCGAFAQQSWSTEVWFTEYEPVHENIIWEDIARSTCRACNNFIIWKSAVSSSDSLAGLRGGLNPNDPAPKSVVWRIIWPVANVAEAAHPKMPSHLKGLYDEARSVSGSSPRAAAALLRLLLEDMLKDLDGSSKSLNATIGSLVSKGLLSSQLQETADYLRIAGNDAVHPVAEIQSEGDTSAVASTMFRLVNLLVQELIAQPAEIRELYESLPESKRQAIIERDSGVSSNPR